VADYSVDLGMYLLEDPFEAQMVLMIPSVRYTYCSRPVNLMNLLLGLPDWEGERPWVVEQGSALVEGDSTVVEPVEGVNTEAGMEVGIDCSFAAGNMNSQELLEGRNSRLVEEELEIHEVVAEVEDFHTTTTGENEGAEGGKKVFGGYIEQDIDFHSIAQRHQGHS